MPLNLLEAVHTEPKIETEKQTTQHLNCRATYTEEVKEYTRSGMILRIYSDAYYISEPEAQSRAGGYFFLGPKSSTPILSMPPQNGPLHIECSIMSNVMASATEAELGGLFENVQKATATRTALA